MESPFPSACSNSVTLTFFCWTRLHLLSTLPQTPLLFSKTGIILHIFFPSPKIGKRREQLIWSSCWSATSQRWSKVIFFLVFPSHLTTSHPSHSHTLHVTILSRTQRRHFTLLKGAAPRNAKPAYQLVSLPSHLLLLMYIPAHSTPGNILDFWLYGEVLRPGKDVKERPHLCKKCKFSEQASCEMITFLCELPALCVCPIDFPNKCVTYGRPGGQFWG